MSGGGNGTGTLRLAFTGALEDLSGSDRARLLDRRPGTDAEVRRAVGEILDDVRERGDEALLEMASRFDGVELETLEVPRERWDDALRRLDEAVVDALERAARNIRRFHEAQIPEDLRVETEPGVVLGRRFVPLSRVGVYAPGGTAAYPSSVLMGVVPARAVGVDEVVVCSPPGPGGAPPDAVLAAATVGGATRLFAVGGAGAVAAMAFGTSTVPRCAAVVGPGNRWVIEAKRQVAGEVVIDAPAGPSEVLVVADGDADPILCAGELLAQAEHDPDAAVLLLTPSVELAEAVTVALGDALAPTPRRDVAAAALAARGAVLVTDDLEGALAFADAWGPEHLVLYTSDPAADLRRVGTAGTAFLGGPASVAHGDYLTGANHVLPTAGTSRSFSGLSALTFLRSYTWQELTADAASAMADDVDRLARAEGLSAHGAAARLRAGDRP